LFEKEIAISNKKEWESFEHAFNLEITSQQLIMWTSKALTIR